MLNENDLALLAEKEISQKQIEEQLAFFKTGFPFLKVKDYASVGNGIESIGENEEKEYLKKRWNNYLKREDARILKFVPASGAASRMFKDLYEFLDKGMSVPDTDFEKIFFEKIEQFAFFNDLNTVCLKNEKKDIRQLMQEGNYKKIIENLLFEQGLNYGNLPKGLLKFHQYTSSERTPMQEHMVEGALYAENNNTGEVNVHFTVSREHRALFQQCLAENVDFLEKRYGVKFKVGFSEQKPSTDTLAADSGNNPFRDKNGNLFFRPGGHGALIENLNDLDADVIFIKNIDNVVPDSFKNETVEYKQILAGLLVDIQAQVFSYLNKLDLIKAGDDETKLLDEIRHYINNRLFTKIDRQFENQEEKIAFFKSKLNRPIRVCGMVRNVGEPGGGPFFVENRDGTVSLQILESTQINVNDAGQKALMEKATYFNPVDLVCAVRNYEGKKFNLTHYVDKETGFISIKSKDGKELKALELPGLWNGAMSDWNTVFVEVPIATFNPVKTVNDLLRKEHQPQLIK